jgi:cytochrome P450
MTSQLSTAPDLTAASVMTDPYPAYNWLREHDPVHWSTELGAWVLSRYTDVRVGFRDAALSSDRVSPVYARREQRDGDVSHRNVQEILSRWIVFTDPPAHTRLRKLVEYAFRPRAVARMDGIVRELALSLSRELEGEEEFDFIARFANPLPVKVIAGMLDVPAEYHEDMAAWSDEIVMLLFGAPSVGDREDRAARGLDAFAELILLLISERRKKPGADLISDLLAAQERGDQLSEMEIVSTCVLLLFAGHETTRNLLANGLKLLLTHPEQWALLKQNPTLSTSATEEILRFEGPIKAMWRLSVAATNYQDVTIEAGKRVLLLQGAANRDPRRFVEPDKFDIQRSENRHVAFGYSLHYCLGAAVARLEGSLGFRAIAEHFGDLELATHHFDYQPVVISRTLTSLPVRRSVF